MRTFVSERSLSSSAHAARCAAVAIGVGQIRTVHLHWPRRRSALLDRTAHPRWALVADQELRLFTSHWTDPYIPSRLPVTMRAPRVPGHERDAMPWPVSGQERRSAGRTLKPTFGVVDSWCGGAGLPAVGSEEPRPVVRDPFGGYGFHIDASQPAKAGVSRLPSGRKAHTGDILSSPDRNP